MRADLHVHSTASDGMLSPSAVVTRACENGVDVLAIADHDSVSGFDEARAQASASGVTLIEAVELSAVDSDSDVHLLAYFVDPHDEALESLLRSLREARLERAHTTVEALRDAGMDVSIDDVLGIAGGGSLGRSHIARALVAAGHSPSIGDAFDTFIGRGRPFYIAKRNPRPATVVTQILEVGAIPVLAHPGVSRVDHLLPEMIEAGLLGIEAYHADHTAEQVAHYAALAKERGLLITRGSDFHGPGAPNPDIGSVDLPAEHVEALLAKGEGR